MNILKFLLKTRDQIQIYHWTTKFYSRHKVSDELYTKLNDLIDRFIESYMSKYELDIPKRIKILKIDDQDFIDYLEFTKMKLGEIKLKEDDYDLRHIMDEIYEELGRAIYLSRQV